MSSSFPERRRRRLHLRHGAWLIACVAPAGAFAAEIYYQPRFELRAEGHTNRDLQPDSVDDEGNMGGYVANAGLQWGRRSQTGEIMVIPSLRYTDYPERSSLEKLEEFLDLKGAHRTARSEFALIGRYARRDAYNAEFPRAGFDPLDPQAPPVDGTGRLIVSLTRTQYLLRPTYTYRLSERRAMTGSLEYQQVKYSTSAATSQVDYTYGRGDVAFRWQYDERSHLDIGPYVARYEARDNSYTSDAFGLRVELNRDVSERTSTGITLRVQRDSNDIRSAGNTTVNESDTGLELMLNLVREAEAGEWRFRLGRSMVPTGAGSVADSDEFHVEFRHAFSPRLSSETALRANRVRARSVRGTGDDRDYASARAALSWALTPTWSLSGGYEATWRDYVADDGDALDHALFISTRFLGLGPQR